MRSILLDLDSLQLSILTSNQVQTIIPKPNRVGDKFSVIDIMAQRESRFVEKDEISTGIYFIRNISFHTRIVLCQFTVRVSVSFLTSARYCTSDWNDGMQRHWRVFGSNKGYPCRRRRKDDRRQRMDDNMMVGYFDLRLVTCDSSFCSILLWYQVAAEIVYCRTVVQMLAHHPTESRSYRC